MPPRIVNYSETTFSLYLRQPRQSLNSGKKNSSLNYPIDFLTYNFIRLGLTRAKALQTVSQFPRETRRSYAALKSNAVALYWNSNAFTPRTYKSNLDKNRWNREYGFYTVLP
jgi:hypothetical protein